MAITPLDLQTMFVRLNEVSKEQSHTQHAAALQQDQEARKLVEQELQHGKSVNSTSEDKESKKVEDDESANTGQEEKRQSSSREQRKDEKPRKEVVKDPEMGKHIDISG